MAGNKVSNGLNETFVLGAGETGYASGKGYQVGTNLFGVILSLTRNGETVFYNQASAAGDIAVVDLVGIFDLPKVGATAVLIGAPLYWDNTAKVVTPVASTNLLIGKAVRASLAGDATARVRLSN